MGVVGAAGSGHTPLSNILPTASAAVAWCNSLLCPFPASFQQRLGKGVPWGCSAPLPSSQLAGKRGSSGPQAPGQEPVCSC